MHPVIIADKTFTGLSAEEILLFRKFLTDMPGEGVEIGCLDGFSTCHLLQCSQLHLTSIDPFIGDSMAPHLVGDRQRLAKNIEPWKDRHTLIEGYSWDIAPNWSKPLDFLFIDGDHNFDAVMRDLADWPKFLKPGALLATHDSRVGLPGGAPFHQGPTDAVKEVVRNHPERWKIVGEAFSLTIAIKL